MSTLSYNHSLFVQNSAIYRQGRDISNEINLAIVLNNLT